MGIFTGRESHLVHPSNRLYNGEVRDFRDALETYIRALVFENRGWDDDEFGRESQASFDAEIAKARRILAEYEAEIGTAERAFFDRLAASTDATTKSIGEAGIARDYSSLAV